MLGWLAQTTLFTAALAVLATLLGRFGKLGPEARHALWLLVLLKFLIPPGLAWPWPLPWERPAPQAIAAQAIEPIHQLAPAPTTTLSEPSPPAVESLLIDGPSELIDKETIRQENVETSEQLSHIHQSDVVVEDIPVRRTSAWDEVGRRWETIASFLKTHLYMIGIPWFIGSSIVIVREIRRIARFRQCLATGSPAPSWLVEEAAILGERMGIKPPNMIITAGVGSPLLWCLERPRLVIPAELIGSLKPGCWSGILAHELAHLARRDHWVVRFELLAEAVWWWHPTFRLARRRLHDESERACDAWVVRAMPDGRRHYAEALVDVCEHLSRAVFPSPALGVGGPRAARTLEGRLLMILRGPIPSRPSRRSALLVMLLAAAVLPGWTLAQQPKDDAKPKEAAPPAEAAKPAQPAAPAESTDIKRLVDLPAKVLGDDVLVTKNEDSLKDMTLFQVQAGFQARRAVLKPVGFRYVARTLLDGRDGTDRSVAIQVAAVVLGMDGKARVDVIEARSKSPVSNLAWERYLLAQSPENTSTIHTSSDSTGPVPFRRLPWQGAGQLDGDGLATAFLRGSEFPSTNPDRALDPLNPRPANLLDFGVGAPTAVLCSGGNKNAVELAGTDLVEGAWTVRVTWSSGPSGSPGIRGLIWLSPEHGFAVVRSEATQDPTPNFNGRRSWKFAAHRLTQVGGVWLPGEVDYRAVMYDANGNLYASRQVAASFEDYQADVPLSDETFRLRLPIQSLDERTGQFTANPPELPAGLLDRLKKAVAESPFGPPGPLPARSPLQTEIRPIGPDGRPIGVATGQKKPSPAPARPSDAPASVDANPAVKPAASAAQEPALRGSKLEEAQVKELVDKRFMMDPEVRALAQSLKEAKAKLDAAQRMAALQGDPAIVRARSDLMRIENQYNRLYQSKEAVYREEVEREQAAKGKDVQSLNDELAILRLRRDARAADFAEAEAQVKLASTVVARNIRLRQKDKNLVSEEEAGKGESELQIASAQRLRRKAEFDEAELLVQQAERRAGISKPEPPEPARETSTDARDAIELLEVQLSGKQAELRGAQAKLDRKKTELNYTRSLVEKKGVSEKELVFYQSDVESAQAEFDQKQSEVRLFELRLKQARRRAEGESTLLQSDVERARDRANWSEQLFNKGYVSKEQYEADRLNYLRIKAQADPNSGEKPK
jgi:beta-lactamase regulating signal transducer with metallopeptidase domain